MPTKPDYGALPFSEQIEFFRRKLNVNTRAWTDVLEGEHDVAFMVAGANRDDLVADFREAVERAIADGDTLAEFRDAFDSIVAKHGWEYKGGRDWRSRVIYETNMRQSYNAGRWAQLQDLKEVMPYWRYRHSGAVIEPRPLHESWDGLILDADDPWWHTHYPANGWGCQCYVEGISPRKMRQLGRTGPDQAPVVEMETVVIGKNSPGGPRTVQTPIGVDPGFGYAPGRFGAPALSLGPGPGEIIGIIERTAQQALEKAARLPVEAAARSAAEFLALPRVSGAVNSGYARWQAAAVASAQVRNASYAVGAIEPALVESLASAGIVPETAVILARDAQVLQALGNAASGLPAAQLARLPALLREPVAVVLDADAGALLYIVKTAGRSRAVVAVNYRLAASDTKAAANTFASATAADLPAVRAGVTAGRLRLLQGTLD